MKGGSFGELGVDDYFFFYFFFSFLEIVLITGLLFHVVAFVYRYFVSQDSGIIITICLGYLTKEMYYSQSSIPQI